MNRIPSPPAVVAHGGAGGPRDHADACERAVASALDLLREGGDGLDAAVRATVILEDDPRLNAGTGSNLRLDGSTIEMDAAVMDHRGRLGAVGAIQRVKNPVLVAREVLPTPHALLCGEGATAFARARGFADVYPISERAHRRYAEVRRYFANGASSPDFPAWNGHDPDRCWNFTVPPGETLRAALGPSDTVGAVVRDGGGGFATAISTGGTSAMLLGRVGDSAIPGAGFFAGPAGAVGATGDGEEIMRQVLSYRVYAWIEAGMPLREALERGLALVENRFTLGLIGITADEAAALDNRTMPFAIGELE